MAYWDYYDAAFGSAPSAAARKARAAKEIARLTKKGRTLSPVAIEGRTIARTFWGKAWCQNLERYSDIENRLVRGRSYVRSGSVVHLEIATGRVDALVQGSRLYEVAVTVKPVEADRYGAVIAACAGKIESVIELLRGKLSGAVMEVISAAQAGLFPEPKQIGMTCSCPDGARMCKHIAAVLYGIGARFDADPKLLFDLRAADPSELVASAATRTVTGVAPIAKDRRLDADLGSMFGIDLEPAPVAETPARKPRVERTSNAKREGGLVKTTEAAAERARAEPRSTITLAELTALGVPSGTVTSWLSKGVLERIGVRGVYRRTEQTATRLRAHAQMRVNRGR